MRFSKIFAEEIVNNMVINLIVIKIIANKFNVFLMFVSLEY